MNCYKNYIINLLYDYKNLLYDYKNYKFNG